MTVRDPALYRTYLGLARELARERGQQVRLLPFDLAYMLVRPSREVFAPEIRGAWLDRWRRARDEDRKPVASLFVYVPFCRARCTYCSIWKASACDAEELTRYKDRLCAQAEFFAPVLGGVPFSHAYIGGGTPSLFGERELDEIGESVMGRVRWTPRGERTAELHPESTTPGKLRAFRRWGFNRVSFGVQSLDRDVLRRVGRGFQSERAVAAAVDASRREGFSEINLDLMYGLLPDDGEAFFRSFRRLAALSPDTITVYPCEPTPYFLRAHFDGDRSAFDRNLSEQHGWLARAREWAERAGYLAETEGRVSGGVEFERVGATSVCPDDCYNYEPRGPGRWLFGLGPHALCYLYDSLEDRLRYDCLPPLEDDPARNRFRLWQLSPRDEMRAYLLDRFARGDDVSAEAFALRFGGAALDRLFGSGLARLAAAGLGSQAGGGWRLEPRLGWDERLAAGMMLFDPGELLSWLRARRGWHDRCDICRVPPL